MKQYLRKLLREVFTLAFDPDVCAFQTVEDLAWEAGLCPATVHNLYQKRTKEPRYTTVYKLCKAIKMDLVLVAEGLEASKRRIKQRV